MHKLTAHDAETQSLDLVADNIAKLTALFPEILTEGADGGKRVDFEALRELLGTAVEDKEERYNFTWHGKAQARRLAQTPSTGTLRPCPAESKHWDSTQNLFIEGDNLEVLKLLQKSYHQRVKMIYIDPPYNTGKDFIYPDNYRDNIANYLELTGQTGEDGRKLAANPETSGRYHTHWLNMMYPRLKLARNLLRDDGVIFISIDDTEVANLRKLCDEIFGEENFIAALVWEKGRKNDAKLISIGHEYMLVVAKKKAFFTERKIKWREVKPGAKEILDEYLKLKLAHRDDLDSIESDLRKFYASLPNSHPSKKHVRYNRVDMRGVWRDDNISWPGGDGPDYDVIHPETKLPCAVPDGGWRYSTPEKMQEMIDSGKVIFRDDHSEPPIRKTYLVQVDDDESEDEEDMDSGDDLPIQVAGSYFYRSALQSTTQLTQLFGKKSKVFNNPKDSEVLMRWMSYIGVSSDDIVLDFFAGSATTAHAVLTLNREDNSKRRYILVQLPEPIDAKAKQGKVSATFLKKIGKPLTIAEISKERIRRAGEKLLSDNTGKDGITALDVGFKVFKLDSTNIKPWDVGFDDLETSLPLFADSLKDDRSNDDVLYEILLKYGLDLSLPITTHTLAGKTVYSIGMGALVVCLDQAITLDTVEGIAKLKDELQPEDSLMRVVFRDSGFADDVVKVNAVQILKQAGIEDVRSV